MSEKLKKDIEKNRKLIIIGIIALMIVIIVALLGGGFLREPIDDSYFVSDDSKLVMSLPKEMSNYETGEYESDVTHIVYSYSGDKITGVRVFFEYKDEDAAREANNNITMDNKYWANGRKLNGKYIIFTTKDNQWNGLTVEGVRSNIDSLREVGGLVENDVEGGNTSDDEELSEDEEDTFDDTEFDSAETDSENEE